MVKMTFTVSLEEFGKKAAEFALDEITYNDLTIRQWIEKIASGEFAEQRHGRWTKDGCEYRYFYYKCNACGFVNDARSKYCPHCGARMDATDTNVEGKGGVENDT